MSDQPQPPYLRLVWSHPGPFTPRVPRRRIDFARAIERHLAGQDGLTDEQFVFLHATGRMPEAPPRPA